MRKRKLNEHSAQHLKASDGKLVFALELTDRVRNLAKKDPELQMLMLADLRSELLEIRHLLLLAQLNEPREE